MTVLYIIDPGTVGGATRSFMEMVVQLQKLGVHPIVLTSEHNEFNDYLNGLGIKNLAIGHKSLFERFSFKGIKWPLRYLKFIYRYQIAIRHAVRILKKSDIDLSTIDLVHTNSARNNIGCIINRLYGIPHIMHIREFGDLDFGCIPFAPYKRQYNEYTNKFVAISEAVKNHWISKGLDSKKITVVYNGIHCEDIKPSPNSDKENNVLKLVIVGGVGAPKGQLVAVKAISLLPKEVKENVILDIIGWYDPLYVKEINHLINEQNLNEQINILGARNDVHEKLHEYQIGLMCSVSEGFGRSTAEYMHASLGVIASNTGANPELICDRETGLIFKCNDAKSLAECICQYYNNRKLLISCSQNGYIKARAAYKEEINAKNIYNLYRKLLKSK